MDGLLRQRSVADSLAASPLEEVRNVVHRMRPKEPYVIMWWIFTASVAISMLPQYLGEPPEVASLFPRLCGRCGMRLGLADDPVTLPGGKSDQAVEPLCGGRHYCS